MAAPSDPPRDPDADSGAVVDPAVLEQRRARREDQSSRSEIERLRAQQQLSDRRTAELEAEVELLTAELDRRAAEHGAVASQLGRLGDALVGLRERAGIEEAQLAITSAVLMELRAGQQQVAHALEALHAEHQQARSRLVDERARRTALEALLTQERADFAAALARAGAADRAEREQLARRLERAERSVSALEAEVRAAGAALADRLAAEEDELSAEARDTAVSRLVTELASTVDGLRESYRAELEALEREREALRARSAEAAAAPVPSIFDRPAAARCPVSADHPALARPGAPAHAPATPPAVVGDLDRAAARLRAERLAAAEDATAALPPPEAVHAPPRPGGPAAPWLGDALARLAVRDAEAAERFLLAALVGQGPWSRRDLTYELELPATGRHLVALREGSPVAVRRVVPGERPRSDFRLAGPAAALAPLVAGGRPPRLAGVRVTGRRWRVRGLLRGLRPVVGLPELAAAGARPEPRDLLALLSARVPAGRVGDTTLRVAYGPEPVAGDPPAPALVVDAAAGRVALAEDGQAPVDATVLVAPDELLAVLAGSAPALVTGSREAVATLHGWLRAAQALPA